MGALTGWSALVVPSLARGRGTGHLRRSAALVRSLRGLGREAFLHIGDAYPGDYTRAELSSTVPDVGSISFSGDPGSRSWTLVVLDRFRTEENEYRRWAELAPVVGLDEGGPARARFDYLLDLLPALPGTHAPNQTAPWLLDAPVRRRSQYPRVDFSERSPLRVLVTFGGEDPADLSVPAALSLSADPRLSVDLLRPSLAPAFAPMERVRVLEPVPDLKEKLADYDLVVTQFGLTAYEAARARVPVLLVSPSGYHEALTKAAGFLSSGIGIRGAARTLHFVDSLRELIERTAAAAPSDGQSAPRESGRVLAERVASFSFPGGASCPLCRTKAIRGAMILSRFPDRTYRRCGNCGLAYMTRADEPPIVYSRDYFFGDYKKQYGVTYLEDFPKLERMGAQRVSRIRSFLKAPGGGRPRLLDIGCAYGPFLSAAKAAGFSCYGLDPAQDAVRFVREELGIPAAAGYFPAVDPAAAFGVESFDAVGMWYVIEHFADLGAALEKVSSLVAPGGVFAFSTPSGSGVSSRCRRTEFFRQSPADHYSIWEPSKTAALLRRYGFRLAKIVVTGHHPERFPGIARARQGGAVHRAAMAASRLFALGDTFEAYAVKEGDRKSTTSQQAARCVGSARKRLRAGLIPRSRNLSE